MSSKRARSATMDTYESSQGLTQSLVPRRARFSRFPRGRKYSISRGVRSFAPVIHRFTRTEYIPNWTIVTGGSGDVFSGINFRLDRLVNSTEFSTLFDQYRIVKVRVKICPRQGGGGPTGNVVVTDQLPSLGRYFGVVDFDDANAPISINQLLQYRTVNAKRQDQEMTFVFSPKYTIAGANTAVGGPDDIVAFKNEWLDMTNTSVTYNGVKVAFENAAGTDVRLVFGLEIKYYLEMKNLR